MRKLLRNSERFEYHASPRMVPHVYKPEIKYVKLTIDKYIPCLNKMRVAVKEASPIPWKMSEQDGQLIARYFGACKEDVWRPSLVAFPRFQLFPSVVHKVPHSFRTTDMLTDAMQQLQDPTFFGTKCDSPLQQSAVVAAVKDQEHEGHYAVSVNGKEAMPHECDGLEVSSREAWNQSVSVPGSPVKKYPIHSFFSGDYVTVDRGGIVSITFVPVLPQTSAFHKGTKNADWHHIEQNKATPYGSTADISWTSDKYVRPVANSGKHMSMNNLSGSAPHSSEHARFCDNVDDDHVLTPIPPKTLKSRREKLDTTFNAKSPQSNSYQEDMELSPRLTLYMEEGIVPESPVEVSHLHLEVDRDANAGFVPKHGSPESLGMGGHTNVAGCRKGPLNFQENGQCFSVATELGVSSRQNLVDQTRAKTAEPTCPSNVKMCTPTKHALSGNLLHDSFSGDCVLRSGGDASGSVQQAPKYRRLCKHVDKIRRNPISFDAYRGGSENCDAAAKTMSNQTEHAMGKKGKGKRRLDTYIDEEVEVSEDADVSEDEDDDLSEDKYEDSFIDDQISPTGEFTQTEHGAQNNGDMMGFYRQSLLTQSPVVLPSRYLDVSDNSASRTGNASCSSEARHYSIETPKEAQTHHAMNSSPSYKQNSLGTASLAQGQCETTTANCESSTKLDCRKRKLSFQQSVAIPVINLEPEPSSHLATRIADEIYFDDAFFENLDLDAIEAEATELCRKKATQSTQKKGETKNASEISFTPPSFDLGI